MNDSTLAWVHGCIPVVGVRHIGEPDLEWYICTPHCKVIGSVLKFRREGGSEGGREGGREGDRRDGGMGGREGGREGGGREGRHCS